MSSGSVSTLSTGGRGGQGGQGGQDFLSQSGAFLQSSASGLASG